MKSSNICAEADAAVSSCLHLTHLKSFWCNQLATAADLVDLLVSVKCDDVVVDVSAQQAK